MNLSGRCVGPLFHFFKCQAEDLIVLHDELDLDPFQVRLKTGGGTGGHNGLKSIIGSCGGADFVRVRVGIGRPPRGATEGWVLGDFDMMESAELAGVLQGAALAVEAVVQGGPSAAQNKINVKPAAR
jgi:PTH1 family peptidyl-tRNA hydrolase